MVDTIALVLLACLYAATIYTDCKFHKIKNIHTFSAVFVGFILLSVQQGIITSILIFAISLGLGLITEKIKIWGPGDTKLFVAASLFTCIILTNDYRTILLFLGGNLIIYLLCGHSYVLWKSNFNINLYLLSLKMEGEIGRMPGALPMAIANFLIIFYNYKVGGMPWMI